MNLDGAKEEVAQEQAEVEITPESRDTKSSMEVMGSVVHHALTVFVLEGHRQQYQLVMLQE